MKTTTLTSVEALSNRHIFQRLRFAHISKEKKIDRKEKFFAIYLKDIRLRLFSPPIILAFHVLIKASVASIHVLQTKYSNVK